MERGLDSSYKKRIDTVFKKLSNDIGIFSDLYEGQIRYGDIESNGVIYKRALDFFGDKDELVTGDDIKRFLEKMDDIDNSIEKSRRDIQETISEKPTLLYLFEGYFAELSHKSQLLKSAVYLEAEKGGYSLSSLEKKKYHQKSLESVYHIFGEPILQNKEESLWLSQFLLEELTKEAQRTHKRLTEGEFDVLKKFLTDSVDISQKTKISSYNTNNKEFIGSEKLFDHQEVLKINKETQYNLYQSLMSVESKLLERSLNRSIIMDDKVAGASVNQVQKTLRIPGFLTEPTISSNKALGTFLHEFNRHVQTSHYTNKYIAQGFRGARYLQAEEGLATIYSALGDGKISMLSDLSSLIQQPLFSTLAVFFAEHFDLEGTKKMLEIYRKLMNSSRNPERYAYRAKRFLDKDALGASTKDMAYSRGVREVSTYLQAAQSDQELLERIKTISFFKLSLQDLPLLSSLKKELGISEEDLELFPFTALHIAKELGIALQHPRQEGISFAVLLNKDEKDPRYDMSDEIVKNFLQSL